MPLLLADETILRPSTAPGLWAGFVVFVLIMVGIDLILYRRSRSALSTRSAALWSVFWIGLAMGFNLLIWRWFGSAKAEEFLAGYLLEESLSVDNLFVFLLVFAFFKVPPREQRRVLLWGIVGAMILRAIMILVGALLIETFAWVLAVFGVILVVSAWKVAFHDEDADPSQSRIVRFCRWALPLVDDSPRAAADPSASGSARMQLMTGGYRGSKFFVVEDGKRKVTTLFLVLLVIEGSDVMFAVDSVPAIFGVTSDPFIVFSSNMFAILGLRALFFLIAAAIQRLRYLNIGLGVVLGFIGVKMLIPFAHEFLEARGLHPPVPPGFVLNDKGHLHLPVRISLLVIVGVLALTALLSILTTRGDSGEAAGGEAVASGDQAAPLGDADDTALPPDTRATPAQGQAAASSSEREPPGGPA
ncbi:MAG: TerC family protein [Planctomycetes bacterium]|nr:TerC family protein [Planctomycetota bacterium]